MNRTILILVALVIAAGAYWQFSYVPAQRAVSEAAAAAEKAAADAAATAEKAAADAKAAEEKAAADIKAAADKAAADAAAAAAAATDAATGAAADVGTAVGDAATMVWDATKLTAEEITARISGAPVPQSVKDTLTATYNSVKDNPAAVQTVLDQLKQAMGL